MATSFNSYTGAISTPFTESLKIQNWGKNIMPTNNTAPATSTAPTQNAAPTQQSSVQKTITPIVKAPQTAVAQQKTSTKSTKTPDYQAQIQKQINDAYKQQLNFLNQQYGNLQSQLPDVLNTVSSPFEQQVPLLQSQLETQQQQGAQQVETTKQQEQQNLADLRRGASEQVQRAQQQFGGVGGSSAAEAAGTIIGQQQLRSQGQVIQQSQMAQQNVANQLRAIQSEYNANVSKLQLQKEQALSQARLDFNKQLQAIEQAKATAGQTKSSQTIQALQNFAAARAQVEQQAQSFQNNLTLMREQAALYATQANLTQSLQPQGAMAKVQLGNLTPEQRAGTIKQITQNGSVNTPTALSVYGIRPLSNGTYMDSSGTIWDVNGNYVGGTQPNQLPF